MIYFLLVSFFFSIAVILPLFPQSPLNPDQSLNLQLVVVANQKQLLLVRVVGEAWGQVERQEKYQSGSKWVSDWLPKLIFSLYYNLPCVSYVCREITFFARCGTNQLFPINFCVVYCASYNKKIKCDKLSVIFT